MFSLTLTPITNDAQRLVAPRRCASVRVTSVLPYQRHQK